MVKSLFHEGEVTVQQRFGEEELAARSSGIIKDYIPPNAFEFVNKQLILIVSTVDDNQSIWTSILIGKPGFVTIIDEKTLKINLTELVSGKEDPFWENIKTNPSIGGLFIDLSTTTNMTSSSVIARRLMIL